MLWRMLLPVKTGTDCVLLRQLRRLLFAVPTQVHSIVICLFPCTTQSVTVFSSGVRRSNTGFSRRFLLLRAAMVLGQNLRVIPEKKCRNRSCD